MRLERSDLLRLPPCPDAPAEGEYEAWCRREAAAGRPLAVDLFSGAGGLSLGLEKAGWRVVAAVDDNARAVETHRANFPGRALQLDLSEPSARTELVESLAGLPIDLVAGGPPCQPYSRAGASKIRSLVSRGTRSRVDPRRELWAAFLSVVLELRPRAVLMENVPDMGLGDDFQTVRRICGDLENSGYETEVRIIDTWRFRVPQHRRRLILLARRDGARFVWPEADEVPRVTVEDAIRDLPGLEGTTGARVMKYTEGILGAFAREMREGAEDSGLIHDHFTRPVRDDDLDAFRLMSASTRYSELPEKMRRYGLNSFDDKYNRLAWDKLSRTITAHIAKDGYWYIHPAEHRTLTVRESARIQTFPDRFRFAGHRSDAFRQIGNAVPPLAGAAAAEALKPSPMAGPGSTDWPDVHRRLTAWATRLERDGEWTAVPGRTMTPLVAAACAVLARPQPISAEDRKAVAHLRDHDRLDEETLNLCLKAAPERSQERLERLRRLLDTTLPEDATEMIGLLGLSPTEAKIFRLLRGHDVLVAGASTVRVAARFCGTSSDVQNPLTDGRIDIARMVGTGENAPLRMAAIRNLALTRCAPEAPDCTGCPMSGAGCAYVRVLEARAAVRLESALSTEGLWAR